MKRLKNFLIAWATIVGALITLSGIIDFLAWLGATFVWAEPIIFILIVTGIAAGIATSGGTESMYKAGK